MNLKTLIKVGYCSVLIGGTCGVLTGMFRHDWLLAGTDALLFGGWLITWRGCAILTETNEILFNLQRELRGMIDKRDDVIMELTKHVN